VNKKILAIAIVACLLVGLGAGLTAAYLSDSDSSENVFTIGSVEIELTEPNWENGYDEGDYPREANDIYPGEALTKDPTITNTGDNPCLIRVKVEKPDYVTIEDLNPNWREHTDDYYYYMYPLNPGESTTMFTKIRFSSDISNDLADVCGTITVTAYAVQAQGAVIGSYRQIEDGIHDEFDQIVDFFNTVFPST